MAESTLSLTFSDLQKVAGQILGHGRDSAAWSVDATAEIALVIQSGVRSFYSPPLLPGQPIAHEWSFLKPTTTLTTTAPYATGTIAIASGVVTLTGGSFPSTAAGGDLSVSGSTYSVSTRDSSTQLTLQDTSVTVASGTSYSLAVNRYTLPDDFGGMCGDMTYQQNDNLTHWVMRTDENLIRQERQLNIGNGAPRFVATYPKTTTGTTGQRYEAEFFPNPDAAYILRYRYFALTHALDGTYVYHYGGALHTETVRAAVAAAAERHRDDAPGPLHSFFMERLTASIAHDLRMRPEYLGKNQDRSDDAGIVPCEFRRTTYNGTLY